MIGFYTTDCLEMKMRIHNNRYHKYITQIANKQSTGTKIANFQSTGGENDKFQTLGWKMKILKLLILKKIKN